MASIKTLYSILGLEPTATAQDIEDAFIRFKIRFPQAKLDADESLRIQFLGIQQAYTTLSDPDLRMQYDRRLQQTGVAVAVEQRESIAASSWESTRNLVIAGLVVLLCSGMWFYYAHQKAKAEKEVIERALRIAEEERRQKAEADEQRRQQQADDMARIRAQQEEYQFRQESQRYSAQTSAEQRRAEQMAELERRRAQQDQVNAERIRQAQQRQTEVDA